MIDDFWERNGGRIVTGILFTVFLIIGSIFALGYYHAAFVTPRECCAEYPPGNTSPVTTVPVENPHRNVTAMYMIGHEEELRHFPVNESDPYEAAYVPLETARMHARVELAGTVATGAFGPGEMKATTGLAFDPDPVVVYDEVTGKRTAYTFYSLTPEGDGFFTTIVASRFLGYSATRTGIRSLDLEKRLLDKAQGYYAANYSGWDIVSVRFVSGCWGRIVQMNLSEPGTGNHRVVNADYWGFVDERRCGASTAEIPGNEIPSRIEAWNTSDSRYRAILSRTDAENISLSECYTEEQLQKPEKSMIPRTGSRLPALLCIPIYILPPPPTVLQ